ncbi:MAG: glycosyltransferase family 4 protein [Kastovskya adunca ATA6-11-RM4]|jgi:glycosyltransferase involved in cell wall biosynthesis|nr:glycosyltransferase family 4 protein [Kastovskya adunca ATA6-11-RM4]
MSNGKTQVQDNKLLALSIVTQFYPPDYAATGQLIEELALQLGEQGLSVQVFTGQPAYAFQKQTAPAIEQLATVSVRRSRTTSIWPQRIRGKAISGLLFCIRSALHLLKRASRCDVLLVTTAPPFLPILAYLIYKLFRSPYICLIYDLYPDVAVELKVVSENHWLVRLWSYLNLCAWKNAQKVIVLSPSMRERLIAKCPDIVDKVVVIHNWADPQRIVPIAKQQNWFAQSLKLVDTFTILYSGNMGRCHDMDTILEAARLLAEEPMQFIFIGSGAKRQACQLYVTQLGLRNCRFLPYQNRQDLPYSLTACDLSLVSVSPGMAELVAPSKLYGALAAGRPIAAICESHSYLQTLVKEARCGATFNNGDGAGLAAFIRTLAANPQLVKQMGRAGRRYLRSHFTPDLIAKQYSVVLQQVVQEQLNSAYPLRVGQMAGNKR